jgi:hypothetical protein
MVIVWTDLKMDEAEKRLFEENQRIVVVHPCPVAGRDFQWATDKVEGVSGRQAKEAAERSSDSKS